MQIKPQVLYLIGSCIAVGAIALTYTYPHEPTLSVTSQSGSPSLVSLYQVGKIGALAVVGENRCSIPSKLVWIEASAEAALLSELKNDLKTTRDEPITSAFCPSDSDVISIEVASTENASSIKRTAYNVEDCGSGVRDLFRIVGIRYSYTPPA